MEKRTNHDANRERLNSLLSELAGVLGPAESEFLSSLPAPPHPVIYVIGNSRAGSTMLMQWLASTGLVCYPTNLMSRFYASPYIGARIQQLLTDPDYQWMNEFRSCTQDESSFTSDLGKTSGFLAPHEFWYFWRRFVPTHFVESMSPEQEAQVDMAGLCAGFAAIENAFDKPLALKGKMFNFNLAKLHSVFDRVIFLHVHRDPVFNCQSILEARRRNYGDIDTWFGVRPPAYTELLREDPYTQIASQVFQTDQAITEQLPSLGSQHVIDWEYEGFCQEPARYYQQLVDKLAGMGHVTDRPYTGDESYRASKTIRIEKNEFDRLQAAYDRVSRTP
jgi:hypothetical protein